MDPAWIGLAGGVAGTAASVAVALRQTRDSERLARLSSDLESERQERERERSAEEVLTRYREPLAAAAFDLQSRCYNILRLDFLERFGEGHERFAEAETTTLFRFAQYCGWTEILRRDIQFLSFPDLADTRAVVELQSSIARRLATSDDDEPLMIWSDEQRAIGERMIVREHDEVLCMGYARFCDEYDAHFAQLCKRLREDLRDPASHDRLLALQHLLCQLIETLDPQQLRYPKERLGRA